ncbi:hypothetical protein HAX54_026875 [Datura stramonium]|uniref:Uncharacterized protein n=1 Tax=Datura stramonium TaxID=4076 RepID=A0ABS8V1X4_DATST|nr:hypothetical protein [Datura stramonium]
MNINDSKYLSTIEAPNLNISRSREPQGFRAVLVSRRRRWKRVTGRSKRLSFGRRRGLSVLILDCRRIDGEVRAEGRSGGAFQREEKGGKMVAGSGGFPGQRFGCFRRKGRKMEGCGGVVMVAEGGKRKDRGAAATVFKREENEEYL